MDGVNAYQTMMDLRQMQDIGEERCLKFHMGKRPSNPTSPIWQPVCFARNSSMAGSSPLWSVPSGSRPTDGMDGNATESSFPHSSC